RFHSGSSSRRFRSRVFERRLVARRLAPDSYLGLPDEGTDLHLAWLFRLSQSCTVGQACNRLGGSTMRRLMLSLVFMVGIAMAGAPAASAGGDEGPVTEPVPDFSGTLV